MGYKVTSNTFMEICDMTRVALFNFLHVKYKCNEVQFSPFTEIDMDKKHRPAKGQKYI